MEMEMKMAQILKVEIRQDTEGMVVVPLVAEIGVAPQIIDA
jgi:hypothetical protein